MTPRTRTAPAVAQPETAPPPLPAHAVELCTWVVTLDATDVDGELIVDTVNEVLAVDIDGEGYAVRLSTLNANGRPTELALYPLSRVVSVRRQEAPSVVAE